MPVYLLPAEPVFPPAGEAEPDGLLAVGGDLSAARLLEAYTSGIFPWFRDDDDIFWFSPDPRMVLFPEELKISSSLGRVIRSGKFRLTADTAFGDVIRACAAAERPGQDGTWIDEEFIEAYTGLHRLGYAHSVEAWHEEKLAGGLYGVSLGRVFFGESMFHRVSDASKVAFCALVEQIKTWQFGIVDCQVETDLLKSLGARNIPRDEYLELLRSHLAHPVNRGRWDLQAEQSSAGLPVQSSQFKDS